MSVNIDKIYIGEGVFALIDSIDKQILDKYTWYKNSNNYAYTNFNGKVILMHRLIMNCPDDLVVDHIDGHRLDNRRINLRICTQSDNIKSTLARRNGTSIYKGVSYNNSEKKWISKICFTEDGKKQTYLIGRYENEEKAAFAYNIIAKEMKGIYAKLNDVELPKEEWGTIITLGYTKKFREK